MKKTLLRSLAVGAACALGRAIHVFLFWRPEYSAPAWLPVSVTFAGGFAVAMLVLAAVALLRLLLRP